MKILDIDLKARLRNKAFWVAVVSLGVMLAEQFGVTAIPKNYMEIVNSALGVFIMLGIVVDPSTKGISDQIIVDPEKTEKL